MQIDKEIFDSIVDGEIFREVRTRIQAVHDPMKTTLTFVCVKGKSGIDWAIYCSKGGAAEDIARYGDKVKDKENILSICSCTEEVLELYRY
jgi:hypothetical protein